MGKIKGPKAHALNVQYGSGNQHQKSKYKDKTKALENSKKEGTQNPSPMPLDPKVEREEKGINALTAIKDSIQNLQVETDISNDPNT